MGLTPVPDDHVATIVTTLEQTAPPSRRPLPDAPLTLQRWPMPDLAKYRALFARVGTPWLWFSRLAMEDAALAAIVHDPGIEVSAVLDRGGVEVGMLELDFRAAGACEVSYFGLVPELAGRGHGRWLMAHALAQAWRPGIRRVWVHTCTLDHPRALGFYRAQGFVAVKRTVETFADPRTTGLLPQSAAPHVPLLASRRQATTATSVPASR